VKVNIVVDINLLEVEDFVEEALVYVEESWGRVSWSLPNLRISSGNTVTILDREDPESNPLVVDFKAIERGFKVWAEKDPQTLLSFLRDEDYDAITGINFIEYCVFGEVVYA
jgi:hypothetical protein